MLGSLGIPDSVVRKPRADENAVGLEVGSPFSRDNNPEPELTSSKWADAGGYREHW